MMSGAPTAAWEMPCSPVEATSTSCPSALEADAQDPQQGLVVVDGEDRGHSGHDHGDRGAAAG